MNKRTIAFLFFLLLLSSFMGAFIFNQWLNSAPEIIVNQQAKDSFSIPILNTSTKMYSDVNFIEASQKSTPSVVFIKTESQQYQRSSFFWGFDYDPFGRIGKVASTGSGVIISENGYIVTNHHVVKNADKIEVVISNSKRNYTAELVGADPSSDLALLKINSSNLLPIQFSNSDEVKIGEWVLAVGNPFNLTSTVTAGIVSAKGRNINIVNNQFPIESFIQTDAAINPGNSGGALVNLNGDLVGVNTAIASKTGSYVGYGFAIPSNIVLKIIEDLKNYGIVQRAFIGIDVDDIDGETADKLGVSSGVLIMKLNNRNENAANLLKAGDIIVSFDGKTIDAKSTFDELLAFTRPGDIVKLEFIRNGENKTVDITLVNNEGTIRKNKRSRVFVVTFLEENLKKYQN